MNLFKRKPRGTSGGGQFAALSKEEAHVNLIPQSSGSFGARLPTQRKAGEEPIPYVPIPGTDFGQPRNSSNTPQEGQQP